MAKEMVNVAVLEVETYMEMQLLEIQMHVFIYVFIYQSIYYLSLCVYLFIFIYLSVYIAYILSIYVFPHLYDFFSNT